MKRAGGIAKNGHRNKPIQDGEVYFFPEVADQIFDYLAPHYWHFLNPVVLDECSNDGVLGKAIKNHSSDSAKIKFHDIKKDGKCATTKKWKTKFDIIVCNPPWKEGLAKSIYFHLINQLSDNGVLLFIINNVFMYQGWKRARELKCQKFYFLPRFVFKKSGKPLLDCGVAVYHKNPIQVPDKAWSLPCYIDLSPELCK
jgi:hypothetical protein